ncbi:MAG TPA: hypothetical protein VFM25_05905 [Verrucomicrobiae bacterium]|nr:hypothetical protein [Verrucomicrobiae bacterium]
MHFRPVPLTVAKMYPPVVTKNPAAVEAEVQSNFLSIFPAGDKAFIPNAFRWAKEAFVSGFKDYQPVDAPYHDFEHALQSVLCMARLLRGRHSAGAKPFISERIFRLGVVAVLFHDSGYIKKRTDSEGTGAKYTVTHVARGLVFAAELLEAKGVSSGDIRTVQNLIRCTDLEKPLSEIPFAGEEERIVGFAIGTADLMSQMAAPDYVDKLPLLYEELAEAERFTNNPGRVPAFSSAADLMRKSPAFWENYVRPRLSDDLGGLFRFLNEPFPDGPNEYLIGIEANVKSLRERFGKMES